MSASPDATALDLAMPPPGARLAAAPVRVELRGAPIVVPSDAIAAPADWVSTGESGRRLPDLLLAADDLAASIRKFEHEVTTVLQMFEQNGGLPALQSVLAAARRVEANPQSADDLDTLVGWLPTACRMLEAEQILVNLMSRVSPRASHASR